MEEGRRAALDRAGREHERRRAAAAAGREPRAQRTRAAAAALQIEQVRRRVLIRQHSRLRIPIPLLREERQELRGVESVRLERVDELLRVRAQLLAIGQRAEPRDDHAVLALQVEEFFEHLLVRHRLVLVQAARGERVGREHAARREQRLHFLQEFLRQQVLGNVFVIECIEHDQVVALRAAQRALHVDTPVALDDARLVARDESEIAAGDAHHCRIDLDDVDAAYRAAAGAACAGSCRRRVRRSAPTAASGSRTARPASSSGSS